MTAYRCTFEPKLVGDYTLVFAAAPVWVEERNKFFEDAVRVNLHVEQGLGWATSHQASPFGLAPMTRPYGLREKSVLQARLPLPKPERSHLAELEAYNAEPRRRFRPRSSSPQSSGPTTAGWRRRHCTTRGGGFCRPRSPSRP
ncbi:hypothetical protein J8F10_32165 [Gemmata sp. G18]|uniref:Uncharacterized protein n=1 Tax=Gemmata palustris TaxID=2822762 RepID=A0ABS5C1Q2_9BACT|nr:hypothetical protein [Gemmata palustris]MBP3959924.1 hypothetical protein [Gemmata palustris]